jgi:CheY-like chemotaxis protein
MAPILVVEDDPDIRSGVAEVLREEGYEVATAAHGLEALEWLRTGNSASLILLDLMMPVMDGWEFRSEQLRDPQAARIPVVVLSGAGDVGQHAASLGADGYLVKPLSLEALFGAAERYCRAPKLCP